MSKNKKKRRPRITEDQAEAGKRLAFRLIKEDRLGYREKIRRICDTIGCGESTAEKWMRGAREDVIADVSDIVPDDLEQSRVVRLRIYDVRARRYRNNADRRIEAGKYNDAVKMESTALAYEALIARVCHWDKKAPEEDLDDPKLRTLVLQLMTRKLPVFSTVELMDMYRALKAELIARQRHPELGDVDMERLQRRADEEQATLDAMEPSDTVEPRAQPLTPGEELAAEI